MCVGKTVDNALGKAAQPFAPGKLKNYVPTLGESADPHYFRTNEKADARHEELGVGQPDIPDPVTPPDMQEAKAPDSTLLTRNRKAYGKNAGGTLLTGPSGVSRVSTAFGSTLLGG